VKRSRRSHSDHAPRPTHFRIASKTGVNRPAFDVISYSTRGGQHVLSDARNRATKFAKSVQPLPQQKENLQFPLAGQSAQGLSDFSPQRVAIARLRLELSMLFRTGMIYHIRY
jgi:hypothetical protein